MFCNNGRLSVVNTNLILRDDNILHDFSHKSRTCTQQSYQQLDSDFLLVIAHKQGRTLRGVSGGCNTPHFFGKPSVKVIMVGKMIRWSVKLQLLSTVNKNTLVGKMK